MADDLRINLLLETKPGQPHAPEGPGWYVDVRQNEGREEIAPRVRITPADAEELAQAVDNVVRNKQANPVMQEPPLAISVREAVQQAHEEAKQSLMRSLTEAQAAARRVAELRARLAEFE